MIKKPFNKALYESIIKQVATTVKKTINEALWDDEDDEDLDDEDGPSTSIWEIHQVGLKIFKKYIDTNRYYTEDEFYDLREEFYEKIAKELGFNNSDEMFCSVDPDDPDEVKWKALQWFTDDLKIIDEFLEIDEWIDAVRLEDNLDDVIKDWTWEKWQSATDEEKHQILLTALSNIDSDVYDADDLEEYFNEWCDNIDQDTFSKDNKNHNIDQDTFGEDNEDNEEYIQQLREKRYNKLYNLPDTDDLTGMPLTKYFCRVLPSQEAYNYLKQLIDISNNTLTTITKLLKLKDTSELYDKTKLCFLICPGRITDRNGDDIQSNLEYIDMDVAGWITCLNELSYDDNYMAKTIQTLMDKKKIINYYFAISSMSDEGEGEYDIYESMLNFKKYCKKYKITDISFELNSDFENYITIKAPTMEEYVIKFKLVTDALIKFVKEGNLVEY